MYGGTYMLSKPDVEVVYSEEGVATGVKSEGETAMAKFVVGDPSEPLSGYWTCCATPCVLPEETQACYKEASKLLCDLLSWQLCTQLARRPSPSMFRFAHKQGYVLAHGVAAQARAVSPQIAWMQAISESGA